MATETSQQKTDKIYIVGIGDDGLDGLTEGAKKVLHSAELLIGAESTLTLVPSQGEKRLTVGDNLDEAVQAIQSASEKPIVVLVSGDPLF